MKNFSYALILWFLSVSTTPYYACSSDQMIDEMELEEQPRPPILSILEHEVGLKVLSYLAPEDLNRAKQASHAFRLSVKNLLTFPSSLLTPLALLPANQYYTQTDDELETSEESSDASLSSSISDQTPFEWQNEKHFKELTDLFEQLAERELTSIIHALIRMIQNKEEFFKGRHESILAIMRERIVSWMKEHVLTIREFYAQSYPASSDSLSPRCSDNEEDEDAWRIDFMEGFDRDDDSDKESRSDYSCPSTSEFDGSDDEENFDKENEKFERWKVNTIWSTLGIYVNGSDELDEDKIDIEAIREFLDHHVEGGYSWLVNEDIEGSMSTSADFIEAVHKEMGMNQEILSNILSGFWFDFDWEEFDIEDNLFIQKTYVKTLKRFIKGKCGLDIKETIIKRLHELFTFHEKDFKAPFNQIPIRYNEYAEKGKWREAMIEWSVYSTYRKIFANPSKKSQIHTYQAASPAHPLFHSFNREEYLVNRLQKALKRARKTYTKVYPHPDTKRVVYGKKAEDRAELDIVAEFIKLKTIGRIYEQRRPLNASNANVFVPMLYLLASKEPLGGFTLPVEYRFIPISLVLQGADKRAITRKDTDVVFQGKDNNYYFDRVRQDVRRGRELQGIDGDEAANEIETIINNKGLCNTQLIHSERVLIEVLRNKAYVDSIAQSLVEKISEEKKTGTFGVYGAVMLGYSTNTVCPNCTPSLIALQNSGTEEGGFLALLVESLNTITGPILLQVKGYNEADKSMDWRKFRLNTFVTASINFDPEAHDLAEEGQHMHTSVSRPPKESHNPHAKLYFLNDEIDIFPSSAKSQQDSNAFFYEFVGRDMHTQPAWNGNVNNFNSVVFASGSIPWRLN